MKYKYIRNVCVIAHVDHGKTSLCDHLIASNGYISKKLAGVTRYLDFRNDEQERFITIQNVIVPLKYKSICDHTYYTINLIDSPGHIDFYAEFTTAIDLCDNSLLLIDSVEGIQPQTKLVFNKALQNNHSILLILTKVDKLFNELDMSAKDCYRHLCRIIEAINAYLHICLLEHNIVHMYDNYFFDPVKLNVYFSASIDGWCCSVADFSKLLCNTLKIPTEKSSSIIKYMWGNYSIKNNKIVKVGNDDTNLAEQCFLNILYRIYKLSNLTFEFYNKSIDKLEKVIDVLDNKVFEQARNNQKAAAKILLSNWLTAEKTILQAIVDKLNTPMENIDTIINKIMISKNNLTRYELLESNNCIVLITKFVAVDYKSMQIVGDKNRHIDENMFFCALGKIIVGTLTSNTALYINSTEKVFKVQSLFIPSAINIIPVEKVEIGNIVLIQLIDNLTTLPSNYSNYEDYIIDLEVMRNNVILSNIPNYIDNRLSRQTYNQNVKVSISCINLSDWNRLLKTIHYLLLVDNSIDAIIDKTIGSLILSCIGYTHLKRIIQDIETYFCVGIQMKISKPIYPIKETIVYRKNSKICDLSKECKFLPYNNNLSEVSNCTAYVHNDNYFLSISVLPIDQYFNTFFDSIQSMPQDKQLNEVKNNDEFKNSISNYWKYELDIVNLLNNKEISTVLCCNKSSLTPNEAILLSTSDIENIYTNSLKKQFDSNNVTSQTCKNFSQNNVCEYSIDLLDILTFNKFFPYISKGYFEASAKGIICEEPVYRVIYVINSFRCIPEITHNFGPIVSLVRNCCRNAFCTRGNLRIYEPYNTIMVVCESDIIGKVINVLSQKKGYVIDQQIDAYTYNWNIQAELPAREYIELYTIMNELSSGKCKFYLESTKWKINETDPFEEANVEDNSKFDASLSNNAARRLINKIREEKGLSVETKTIDITGKSTQNLKNC